MKERIKKWQYMIMQQPLHSCSNRSTQRNYALTQSNQQVKFINAQTIKLPRMAVTGYKDHTRTPGFNVGTLSNDWEAKKLEHDRDVEFWIDPMDIDETRSAISH